MTTENLTFSKDRLVRLKDEYAIAVEEGKEKFAFDGYILNTSYAKSLIVHISLITKW